ncbi:hypothetical protein O181_096628 [Austropuccinia psidii MF-1]|uniref:Uncharacterized protein n=1 Tax=Austropuccinia psidii MF-1 TaxID=1389203 RepID=A0A9Q3J5X4_9BASI|nr:hypothetical protein [Austropuccinia psidii MF-1]
MDYYSQRWYKKLSPHEKRIYPDRKNVAFLPDAEDSLQPKRHPDEKCTDKQFNEKYREEVAKLFELSDEEESADEEEADAEEGESINLEAPSEGEEDNDEGEFYGPGEYLYDDDDFSPQDYSSSKEEDDEGSIENNEGDSMEGVEE